jgi:hypothetical protein
MLPAQYTYTFLAAHAAKVNLTFYHLTRYHNSKNLNFKQNGCENLKGHNFTIWGVPMVIISKPGNHTASDPLFRKPHKFDDPQVSLSSLFLKNAIA